MAEIDSTARKGHPVQLNGEQLDELHFAVAKALGIAMALSEKPGDKHDQYAAAAIADYLHSAKKILGGEETAHV